MPRFGTCPVCKREVMLTFTLAREAGQLVTASIFTKHSVSQPGSHQVGQNADTCAGSGLRTAERSL